MMEIRMRLSVGQFRHSYKYKQATMGRFFAVALLTICSAGIARAGWELVWEDQFDGGNLKDRWNFELGCSGKKQSYLNC